MGGAHGNLGHCRIRAIWYRAGGVGSSFLAKGLLEVGAGEGVAHPPPSFQAMARAIALVQADAGHLLRVLHQENPFAGAMRRRLLEALIALDRELEGGALYY